MAAGSRKRRRPDGRNVSPPLTASPLLTRNLQLLPVGLTQLPNDETFVHRLRNDVDDLLSAFAEALLLSIVTVDSSNSGNQEAGPSSRSSNFSVGAEDSDQHTVSPFSVFAHLWRQKGWQHVQFAFGDHTDSKRTISETVCRVLLEQLEPLVAIRNRSYAQLPELPQPVAFTDLKQAFKVIAVPFALYTFWSTQIYATSGIGVKHCRAALERISIEQDYYDLLLDLPEAVLQHLQHESRTNYCADDVTADLIEVMCRLVGEVAEEDTTVNLPRPSPLASTSKTKSGNMQPGQNDIDATTNVIDPVFDIVPESSLATRMPRIWPSVRVISSMEANKEFGRVGSIVRISSANPWAAELGRHDDTDTAPAESREVVAGLSRGDVVRLKAKQRLAKASINVSSLLEQHGPSAASDTNHGSTLSQAPQQLMPLRATMRDSAPSQAVRYEIETPSWIKCAKSTAKMQQWIEEASMPVQQSLQRVSKSKSRYQEVRDKIMRSDTADDDVQKGADYGEWILQSFREKRKELQERSADASDASDLPGNGVQHALQDAASGLPNVEDAGTLTLDSLYRLAAEQTRTAAVERGEMLKSARASGSRLN